MRRRKAPRRAKSPALHCGRERTAIHKRQPPSRASRRADEIIGPYAGGSTPQPSSARHACRPRFRRPFALHCRAGVHARRKSLRRPGRILAGPGAAPLSRLCRQLPFQGSLSDGSLPKASPARGGGCAARRRRRGALPLCGGSILQSRAEPCPVFRKGRCSHRPGSLRCRKAPRRAKSPALHCGRERTAIHKRQPPSRASRRADEIIGPYAGGSTPQPSSIRHACRPRSRRPFALHCRAGVHARREGLRRRPPFLQKKFSKKPGRAAKSRPGRS